MLRSLSLSIDRYVCCPSEVALEMATRGFVVLFNERPFKTFHVKVTETGVSV